MKVPNKTKFIQQYIEIVLTHQKPFPKMGYEPGPCHIPPHGNRGIPHRNCESQQSCQSQFWGQCLNVPTHNIQNHFMKRTWPKCLMGPVISEFPSVRWKNLSPCQELTCEKHLDPYFPRETKQIWRTLPSKDTRSLAFLLNEYVGNIPPTCSKHPICIPDTTRISTVFIRNPNLNLHWLLASLSGLSRSNKYPFKGSAPWKSKFSFDNFAKLPKNPSNKSTFEVAVWYMLVDGLKRLDFLPVGTPRN